MFGQVREGVEEVSRTAQRSSVPTLTVVLRADDELAVMLVHVLGVFGDLGSDAFEHGLSIAVEVLWVIVRFEVVCENGRTNWSADLSGQSKD